MSDTPIYDELAEKFGITVPYFANSATSALPIVDPITQAIPVVRPAEDLSWADPMVKPSYNGLRPEDEQLPQPPQDPQWRPGVLG